MVSGVQVGSPGTPERFSGSGARRAASLVLGTEAETATDRVQASANPPPQTPWALVSRGQ